MKESVYFIYRLFIYQYIFILAILYTVLWRYKKDCLRASIDIVLYIMFYIINTLKKLYSFIPRLCLRNKRSSDLSLPPSLPPPVHYLQQRPCHLYERLITSPTDEYSISLSIRILEYYKIIPIISKILQLYTLQFFMFCFLFSWLVSRLACQIRFSNFYRTCYCMHYCFIFFEK